MKIYITGPAWSWKSTLAKKLGEYFHVPVIHLDQLCWNADWTEKENYHNLQKEAIMKPNWIIEWASCSIVKSMQEVDRIIILDYSPIWNIWRILLRRLKSFFGIQRLGVILPDNLNFNLARKTLIWRKRQLPRLIQGIEETGLAHRVITLFNRNEWFEILKIALKNSIK